VKFSDSKKQFFPDLRPAKKIARGDKMKKADGHLLLEFFSDGAPLYTVFLEIGPVDKKGRNYCMDSFGVYTIFTKLMSIKNLLGSSVFELQ
jgi:hypothetical protein